GAPLYDPQASFDRVKAEGAVPWEELVQSFDRVGTPTVVPAPPAVPAPASPTGAVAMSPGVAPAANLAPTTALPITPIATAR
ncbi:MAG: hypothetical protein ABIO39_12520, partial [Caulobacteraceae bacterium]